jgi:peptidoglycan/LPS O-acetylase OafA/YrhL
MPKANNFDLIRLVAALQVVVNHCAHHFGIDHSHWPLFVFTSLFPGVPIFFFTSGFLISRSYENNPVLGEFALNRILRIYPALIVCFAVSLALVAISGYFARQEVPPLQALLWGVGQLSFIQFYNPEFMRDYGVGVLNGSMWTISVELQFYVLTPLLYASLRLLNPPDKRPGRALLGILIAFVAVNLAYSAGAARYADADWYKLVGVSFAPWFYLFLIGVVFQRHFEMFRAWLGSRFASLVLVYAVAAWVWRFILGWSLGNDVNPMLSAALCAVTFAAAFSGAGLADRLLHRNDLSYGAYIYHMPIVNFLIAIGLGSGTGSFLIAIAATLVLAYGSWRAVEKPALRFKRHALYQHDRA